MDEPAVLASDAAGDLMRRGLTVASYSLLETFISNRLNEIAAYLNGGHVQFLDLPEGLQRRAIQNTLRVASTKLRRLGNDLNDLRPFSHGVGTSLAAVARELNLSPMTWLWEGSNMAVDDYYSILRLFHADKPKELANDVAARLGFTHGDLEAALDDLRRERHACAHEALHGVTAIWIRSVPDRVLQLAAALDVIVSIAAVQLRSGDTSFLADPKWLTGRRFSFRFVRDRTRGAAEILEGRARAFRVGSDGELLFREAIARCQTSEAVVRQTALGEVITWTVPPVD